MEAVVSGQRGSPPGDVRKARLAQVTAGDLLALQDGPGRPELHAARDHELRGVRGARVVDQRQAGPEAREGQRLDVLRGVAEGPEGRAPLVGWL